MSVIFLIDCPRDNKKVPIWTCAGSFVQETVSCDCMQSYRMGPARASVECSYPKKAEGQVAVKKLVATIEPDPNARNRVPGPRPA